MQSCKLHCCPMKSFNETKVVSVWCFQGKPSQTFIGIPASGAKSSQTGLENICRSDLLNLDMSCLCKQCSPDQLASSEAN